MNRRQRKEFLEEMRVKAKVVVAMPPRELPMIKEYKIGRNDPCPCGATRVVDHGKNDGIEVMLNGVVEIMDKPCLHNIISRIPIKYKNCCLTKGKFENYVTK